YIFIPTSPPELYPLSLHDALPIFPGVLPWRGFFGPMPTEPNRVPVQVWYTLKRARGTAFGDRPLPGGTVQLYQADSGGRLQLVRSEEHTSELQSRFDLVCRLLLEK